MKIAVAFLGEQSRAAAEFFAGILQVRLPGFCVELYDKPVKPGAHPDIDRWGPAVILYVGLGGEDGDRSEE